MTPDELKRLLEPYGIRPIRDRGQHFLLDERVVEKMADAAGIGKGSRVVEIGPGPGILTAALLRRGAVVVAVELDRKLAGLLGARFASSELRLVLGDIRSFSNAELVARFNGPSDAYRVVANLPYAVTSDTLKKFLFEDPKPASLTLMVQREVADRILAAPGDMGALSVMVQTLTAPRRVVNVPRGAFFPSPKVDSAVIHMELKSAGELAGFWNGLEPEKYFTLSKLAFSQPRKRLKNSLSSLLTPEKTAKKSYNEAEKLLLLRPEELGVPQWLTLARTLTL